MSARLYEGRPGARTPTKSRPPRSEIQQPGERLIWRRCSATDGSTATCESPRAVSADTTALAGQSGWQGSSGQVLWSHTRGRVQLLEAQLSSDALIGVGREGGFEDGDELVHGRARGGVSARGEGRTEGNQIGFDEAVLMARRVLGHTRGAESASYVPVHPQLGPLRAAASLPASNSWNIASSDARAVRLKSTPPRLLATALPLSPRATDDQPQSQSKHFGGCNTKSKTTRLIHKVFFWSREITDHKAGEGQVEARTPAVGLLQDVPPAATPSPPN